MAEHITDEQIEQLFKLADEIVRAPSRFTKDFIIENLALGVADLCGVIERLRAHVTAERLAAEAAEAENDRLRAQLAAATEFTFRPDYGDLNDAFSDDPEQHDAIVLSWRGPSREGGDPDRWAIKHHHHNCWTRSSGWEFEPRPSSRDDDFLNNARFSRDEAVAMVPALLREIESRRIPELRRMVEAREETPRTNGDSR